MIYKTFHILKEKLSKTWHPRPEQTQTVPHCIYVVIYTSSQICECLFEDSSSFLKVSRFYPLRLVHEAGLLHFSVKVEISNTASLQPDYLWTCVEVAEGNLIGHDWVPNY